MTEKVNFYNPNDGIHGRTDGGPYLDREQQVEQERLNAFRENRDPDYENLPLYPGITPVSETALVQSYNSTALAGQANLSSVEISAAPLLVAEVETADDAEEKSAKEKREASAKAKESEKAKAEADKKAAEGKNVTDNVTGSSSKSPTENAAEPKNPVPAKSEDPDDIKVD